MYRKRILLLLGLALCAAGVQPSSSEAQSRSWTGSIGAGPSLPISNLADEAKTGYHMQGSLAYRRPGLPIGLRLDLFYQLFRNVEREPGLHTSLGGEWFRQANAFLSLIYAIPMGSLAPYLLVGGGWGQEWHGDRSFYGTRHGNVSVNGGAGVDFPILGTTGFVEARVMGLVSGNPLPLNPPAVQDEVRFRSIPITFGVRF